MPSMLDELRAANQAATAPTPQVPTTPQAPAQPCSCGFRTFWLDAYGNWSCSSCKPPKLAFLARKTITLGDNVIAEEITASDEARYDKFIEITGADRRVHLVHRDCLDPSSDYFDPSITKKIAMGVEAADNEFFSVHRYLSKLLTEKNSIDRLPGPWPMNRAENFSLQSEEKPAAGKNKKTSRATGAGRGRKR